MAVVRRDDGVEVFDRNRGRLFGIAYRMLGTRPDAEDIVQDAYLRWHNADRAEIESADAWLTTVATRLSIDRLRKASVQRETYIGPWLPEPLIVDPADSPEAAAEIRSDVSLAFMVMLERLSPMERAVFLLHDVFDFAHAEIAKIVAKSETAVRQIVSRARARVRGGNQGLRGSGVRDADDRPGEAGRETEDLSIHFVHSFFSSRIASAAILTNRAARRAASFRALRRSARVEIEATPTATRRR